MNTVVSQTVNPTIVTLTPNPSLDRTAQVEGKVTRGGVHRLGEIVAEPGGKGVNVARAIHQAGVDVVAVVPADDADPLVAGMQRAGLPYRNVPIGAPVRANLTLTEADGTTSKFNELGATLSAKNAERVVQQLVDAARGAQWVVLSGSLPPGAPADWYPQLIAALRPLGVRIAVDTSDAPLQALAAALPGSAPDVIKPNSEELGQLIGRDGLALEAAADRGDWQPVLDAARELTALGVGAVLVTLGGAGALLVTESGAWLATPPPTVVASTVGAGDSSLAGYLLSEITGAAEPDRLRHAVAYGSGAAALPGSQIPRPDQIDPHRVQVSAVDAH